MILWLYCRMLKPKRSHVVLESDGVVESIFFGLELGFGCWGLGIQTQWLNDSVLDSGPVDLDSNLLDWAASVSRSDWILRVIASNCCGQRLAVIQHLLLQPVNSFKDVSVSLWVASVRGPCVCVASSKRVSVFVSRGATQILLHVLVCESKDETECLSELLVAVHQLLAKLGPRGEWYWRFVGIGYDVVC